MDEFIVNSLTVATIGAGIFALLFRENRRAAWRFFKRLFRISSPSRSLQGAAPEPDPIADMTETKKRIRQEERQDWAERVVDTLRWVDVPDHRKYEIAQRLGARLRYDHPLAQANRKHQEFERFMARKRAEAKVHEDDAEVIEIHALGHGAIRQVKRLG